MAQRFIIQTIATPVLNVSYLVTFTGIAQTLTGSNVSILEAAAFRCSMEISDPEFAVDAPDNIGVSYSPAFSFTLHDKIITGTTTLYKLLRDAARFDATATIDTATPFSATYKGYSKGIYCTIEESAPGVTRTVIFRGFIDQKSFKWDSKSGAPENTDGHIHGKLRFDCRDRHATFLGATKISTIAADVLADAGLTYYLVPDSDIPDASFAASTVYRNAVTESGTYPSILIPQVMSTGGEQRGTYEGFLTLQRLLNILQVRSGGESATASIDLSHYRPKYDERYPFTSQRDEVSFHDPNGAGVASPLTDNASMLFNASKMFMLNDTAGSGIDWSLIDPEGESWLDFGNASELLNELCETFGLIAVWNETSTNVLQMQLKPRNTLVTTIDLDSAAVTGRGMLSPYSEEPFSEETKDFVVVERDGGETNYPSELTPTEERDDVTVQAGFRAWDEEENNDATETAQRNFLWARNAQTIDAKQGTFNDSGTWEILKIIPTPTPNGVAYAIGISTNLEDGTQHPIVFKTTDSGVKWYLLNYTNSGLLRDGVALSETVVIVVGDGGVIYKTTDGGITWVAKTSNVTGNIIQIQKATGTTYYAITSEARGFVIKSIDDGEIWVTLTSPAWTGVTARLTAMNVSENAGTISLIVGVRDDNLLRTQIWKTTDVAGETFNATPIQSQPLYREIFAFFRTGTNTMYAAGGGLSGGLLWNTTDNWATYSEITNITGNLTNEYHSLYFTSTTSGFVGGKKGEANDDGILYLTADTGTTWAAKRPTGSTFTQVNSLVLIDTGPDTIVLGVNAVSSSKSFKYSTDNGDTWTEISRNVDITNALSPCPLLLGIISGSNVKYWSRTPTLTTVTDSDFRTNFQVKIEQALTYALEFRAQFYDAFKKRSVKFRGRILNFAQRTTLITLKLLFKTFTHRALTYKYLPKVDTSEFTLMEITAS